MNNLSNLPMIKIPAPDAQTIWEDEDYGIRHGDEFCRYDNRGILGKAVNFLGVNAHGASYSASAGVKRLNAIVAGLTPSKFEDETLIGRTGSLGLIILFHGLHGQSSLWDGHLESLSQFPEFDTISLEVPEAGVCSLKDPRFELLLNRIVDWAERNPLKPITFFGQSNGSRVATYYETLLRERAPKNPVHVALTGAVLYGSETVQAVALDKLYETGKKMTCEIICNQYNVYEDLNYGSEASKELLERVRAPLDEEVAPRYYTMYAPWHDHHVHSLGSALPIINPDLQASKTEEHYIVFNYGHNAIPLAVKDEQVDNCIRWMKEMINPDVILAVL